MALSKLVIDELGTAIGESKVLTSNAALAAASRDETHGLEASLPDVVLMPHSHEDVEKIARVCAKHKIAMTPRGAGTGKSGGAVPINGGAVIDFSKLNKIVRVNTTDFLAVVEPGVVLGEFQKQVEALGLFYPPDPASLEWCTLGGNVAENAGGPSAVKYGVTKDYVLGMRVVLSDGRSFRIGKQTIKGVTGFDLVSLICGSEGVLAFVTEITLRLLPKPAHVLASLLRFASRESALLAVAKVRACGGDVKCIEFIDSSSMRALNKGDDAAALLIEVDGNDRDALLNTLHQIDERVKSHDYLGAKVAVDEKQRQELWKLRRQLSEATKKLARFKISEDIVVPLSKMNDLLNEVDKIALRYSVRTCAFGHAGDGNLHLQFLFDDEKVRERLPALLSEVFAATVRSSGTLTGEHGVGLAKRPYLSLEQEEGLLALQRQLKAVFDSQGLLNPGKIL